MLEVSSESGYISKYNTNSHIISYDACQARWGEDGKGKT